MKRAEKNNVSMLPAAPGTCRHCAVKHRDGEPHNVQSLFYQMRFNLAYGRWPKWEDALAHCDGTMRELWIEGLKSYNITVAFDGTEIAEL